MTGALRTVTYGAACSLDGFIARKDHSVDWLQWSDDVSAITSLEMLEYKPIKGGCVYALYRVKRRQETGVTRPAHMQR